MKENRLDILFGKYWAGKTSLEEESEIRKLLDESGDLQKEKQFFRGLKELKDLKAEPIKLNNYWKQFLPYAAVFLFVLVSGWLALSTYQSKQEQQAYIEVMQAFDLIQENMQKGTSQIQVMGKFRHLNTTHELFNIEEIK